MRTNPRPLSPPCSAIQNHSQRLVFSDWGRPDGEVWLSLHGGPGSGSGPAQRAPFDAQRHRVIVPDQRGAGRSRPRGRTRGNDLNALIADLEALRQHLGIVRWHVLGGSWGATLAVAYAARHPNAVGRLVLRGVFDAHPKTVRALFETRRRGAHRSMPGLGPTRRGAALWRHVLQVLHFGAINSQQQRVIAAWAACERSGMTRGLSRGLRDAAAQPRHVAMRQQRRALKRSPPGPSARLQRARRDVLRIQAHYFSHRCFVGPGDWARVAQALAKHPWPIDVVHGRHDLICPVAIAQAWVARVPQARLHLTQAGHLGHDADNLRQLRACVA